MNPLKLTGPLVSTTWLAANISHPDLIVLDASMKPVGKANVNVGSETLKQITGSRIFDFDKKICNLSNPLPHMMPTPEIFEKEVRSLGVGPDSIVIVYDREGIFSSPRAYWMFKAMGHDQVAVLDGGFPAWVAEGHETVAVGSTQMSKGKFIAKPRPYLFCNVDQVKQALNDRSKVILDARSIARFYGREPEPRAGLRSGHMPNALNIPFSTLISNGKVLPTESLKEIFSSKIKPDQKIIASCGSGVTACVIALAAELAGYKDISVYDGSWSEWGMQSLLPVIQEE